MRGRRHKHARQHTARGRKRWANEQTADRQPIAAGAVNAAGEFGAERADRAAARRGIGRPRGLGGAFRIARDRGGLIFERLQE